MLSRNLRRALLDSRWPLPPTFLLPWAANLTTASHSAPEINTLPPSTATIASHPERQQDFEAKTIVSGTETTDTQALPPPGSGTPALSASVRDLLPLLQAQDPHYITAHIHGRPYLLTQGDTIRLPFYMHGVEPGDVLRLNRAINLGSRDFTLKAAAAGPRLKSTTMDTTTIIEPTVGGTASSETRVMPGSTQDAPATSAGGALQYAPHFIPNIAKGKHAYLDERLFVCRAVVMGVDSEPLRIKEKTKRRQRRVKKVKSKHRFTLLRVKELRVRGVEEMEAMGRGEEVK